MSKRMTWATVALVAVAVRAWGLTFGVGCADGCGVEQALVGEDHPCAAVLVNDGAPFPIEVDAVHVVVHHADGDVTESVLGAPELVQGPAPAMTTVPFTVPIEPDDALLPGGNLALDVSADLTVLGVATFGDRIAIVGSAPPCHAVTTTTTTTVTTTTATTTTLLAARHPCNPHANPNARWCR